MPQKIFEYMAAGLPLVSSDLPLQSEIIARANCGLLARPEDVSTFADAICTLIDDPALARRLGKNGQDAVRHTYSWEALMPKLDAFYREIVQVSQPLAPLRR